MLPVLKSIKNTGVNSSQSQFSTFSLCEFEDQFSHKSKIIPLTMVEFL